MTSADRFDRRLETGLDEVARPSFPDYFPDILAETSRTRQRPAWVFPERWIPMVDIARRPAQARPVPWRPVLIGAALILALTAAAVALIGSPRPDVPSPLGLARNGDLAIVTNGTLSVADRTLVASGVHAAAFSPDGRSIAYIRDTVGAPGFQLAVVDVASGTQRYAQQGSYGPESLGAENFQFAWSPDGSRIAFESGAVGGTGDGNGTHATAVSIIDLTTGAQQDLDLGFAIGEAAWRPTGGDLLVRGWKDDRAGLFLMRPDGTEVRQIVVAADDLDDLGQPVWSPDGTRIAYVYGERPVAGGAEHARLHLVNADGSNDTIPSDPAGVEDYWPVWSPDGTRIALSQFTFSGREWIAIQPIPDGERIRPEGTRPIGTDLSRVVWSPDGRQALLWIPDGHLQRLDPATANGGIFMIGVDAPPSWQRLPLP